MPLCARHCAHIDVSRAHLQVKLHDGGETLVPSEDLEAVLAQKNSSVMILQGELKGNTGKLIGIDGRDGIVKMDMNQDIKIVDMPSLAVYVADT
jgi:transcription elongation factor SPT5